MKKTYILQFTKKELQLLSELIIKELAQNIETFYDMTLFELINTDNQSLKSQWDYVSILKKMQLGGNLKTNDEYNK